MAPRPSPTVDSLHASPALKIHLFAVSAALALVVAACDQVAKWAVRGSFALNESREVVASFFSLTYVRNTGAVWGSFQDGNEWLALVSMAVAVLLVMAFRYLSAGRLVNALALGAILGGITGNMIDRIRLGWVTDFLDFYVASHHWPAFNVADAAIVAGVGLYLIAALRSAPGSENVARGA